MNESWPAQCNGVDHAFELCGVCGSTNECTPAISTTSHIGKKCAARVPASACARGCGYPLGIATAQKLTVTNPCTNVPVECPFSNCNAAVWRYNWVAHLRARHQAEANDLIWRAHASFVVTPEEKAKMAALRV